MQNLGVANEKMTCLGKKRTLLTAMPGQRGRNEFASGVRRSPGGSFFFIAAWMIFLTCGLGWASQATPGNGGGYAGDAVVRPAPSQPQREHLGEWLRLHQNMSFPEQERALRTEPGFNRLPPAKQQKLLERLQQLDAMPPARRERMLARLETWERLSPEQRQQVRVGILEVHQMPFDRQVMIHRAVRDLSEFPQWQRGDILNSPEFRHHYSDYERQVLATLMMAQPYEPLRPQ